MKHFQTFFAAIVFSIFLLIPVEANAQQNDTASDPASNASALIEVLKDEQARNALIEELERLSDTSNSSSDGNGTTQEDAATEPKEQSASAGRRLANFTKSTSEALVSSISMLGERLTETGSTLSAVGGQDTVSLLWEALRELLITIVVTYVLFFAFRAASLPIHRYLGAKSHEGSSVRSIASVTASTIVDIAVVAAAWAAGYFVAIYFLGQNGEIGIRQTLYLNAFLIVEIVKVAIRTVISPSTEKLRWINMSTEAARYLYLRLNILVSIIGYGHLLILPIINQNISQNAGTAVGLLIALVSLGFALALVLRNKTRVADWLADSQTDEERSSFFHSVAAHWHYPVMLYLGFLFVLVVLQPDGVLLPVLIATGKIILVLLAGTVVIGATSRALTGGINMPATINHQLPLLESRLNKYVPKILMVVRIIVIAIMIIIAADIAGLFDVGAWLQSQVGAQASASIVSTLFILAFAFLVWLALSSWIDYRLNPEVGRVATSRERTLLSLLRNAGTIAILIITLMFALSELGLDIAPLIASAGVLGLAIGFGAQKLVQDIITGIFIQLENAINVGDVITLNSTTGTVERLTIRSVSLRDVEGAYHIIPFSSVDMVTNYMREFAYFLCDMGVAYRESTEDVKAAMTEAFEELKSNDAVGAAIIGDFEWMGVQSFGDNAVVMRSRIKTKPGSQWATGRAYNAIVKRIFDERGIEMPFPHRTVYFGEDKEGNAPAAPLTIESKSE